MYPTLLVLPLALSNVTRAGSPPTAAVIQRAIDDFAPLWSPPRGEMVGWTIALGPGDNAQLGTPQRLDDDLSLLTASHLYHLIQRAGGAVVLLRADDTLAADAGRQNRGRRFDIARTHNSGICLVIRHTRTATRAAVTPLGERPVDTQLATAMQIALNAGPTPTDATLFRDADGVASAAPAVCGVALVHAPEITTIDANVRRACFEDARRLYDGLRSYCAQASAPPPSAEAAGDTPNIRGAAPTPGRLLWPAGPLPAAQADWFCGAYARTFITNPNLVYFDVSATTANDGVTLRGSTNVPAIVSGLERAFRDVGIESVRNEVRTLPDRAQLGDQLFGICRAPMALTYLRPQNVGGRQTQIVFGEPLFLLDRRDGCYLLHGGDGYWGWVDEAAVLPMTAAQFDAYVQRPTAVLLRDITSENVFIPRSARVRLADATPAAPRILLPDGTALAAPPAALALETPAEHAAQRVGAALELLGVPYVFGGRSPLGVDCSGLITSAWVRDGRAPGRDVWQQAFAGQLVATAWHRADIRAGDQLFFINKAGKLYHTAIALDATHFVHSAAPCVQISSFDPRDPLYDVEYEEAIFMVKRP